MNHLFISDYERFTPNKFSATACFFRFLKNHELRFLYWGRQFELSSGMKKKLVGFILLRYRRKYGLEITFNPGSIGAGLRLVHPWDITVNANVRLGERVTLNKGCTIGVIDGGAKAGNPIIGNDVTVFSNATVCGNIIIGDRVDIAAGAFVNFDVPDDSLVIGNPGTIHPKRHS